jgi:hypothetical protein
MEKRTIESQLVWITPPECQGQMVVESYASGEEGVYRRTVDRTLPPGHQDGTSYELAVWDDLLGPAEPWNRAPRARRWQGVSR